MTSPDTVELKYFTDSKEKIQWHEMATFRRFRNGNAASLRANNLT